jgi:uncharacterized membrane protein HdeD (DUF308 family)
MSISAPVTPIGNRPAIPIAAGGVAFALGVMALSQPVAASFWGDLIVGLCVAGAGVAKLWSALRGAGGARRILAGIVGAAYLALGLFAATHLLIGTIVLTVLLGIGLLLVGVAQVAGALTARDGARWPGLAAGAVSLGLAGYIAATFPGSAFGTLGVLLGVELIAGGLGAIAFALTLRPRA